LEVHVQVGTVDLNKCRGLSDKGLGFAKEVVGTLVGSERLQDEGQAQQDRATEELKALRKQVEAQRHESEAAAAAARQRAAQRAKEA
jgi:uncharacterized protein YjbJ (UPF0337 family)